LREHAACGTPPPQANCNLVPMVADAYAVRVPVVHRIACERRHDLEKARHSRAQLPA